MKKITFLLTLMLLTLGIGSAWAATYTGDFVKITSVNELTTGYYVIVASESASANSYAVGSTVNSNKRIEGVSVTIVNDKITNPDNTIVYYITKVGSKYTFQNVNTSKYLYQASTTSGKGMGFNTSSKEITCAGYSTNAPIGFKFTLDGASNNFFKWNNSSKWFANYANDYTTSMAPVRLYKLASAGGDEPETPVASLTTNSTTIDFGTVYEGATVADKTVAVNFENLTGNVTYSGLSTPFSATGAISATGDKITISADASTIGAYSQTLTVASTADSKTAEVTVKMNVVEKPAPTGTFTLYTGDLIEGDYVIYYSGKAMKAVVSSNRLGYEEVTPSGNEIIDPLAETIWHIAPSGSNWTIYNDNKGYAAGNGTKNQAALVADPTGDNANKVAWTITGTSTYEFVNVLNKSNSVNANLRNNGTYGFACYATSTGGALSLYRKAGEKYDVKIADAITNGTVTADPTSAEAGTTIALTVTPDAGYVLDALTVTDASSNTVTVTNNEFTMPASDVTVTATFKLNEKPAATLTLSKNEVTEDITGYKQDDVVTLPSITSDCVKEFVGWSADANCAIEPEYKAGEEYTLAETAQTLYAVYATAGAGETLTITPSAVSGSADPYTFTIDVAGYSLTAKKNGGSTAPAYSSAKDVRIYAKGTLTLTAPKVLNKIVFNLSEQGKERLAPITASVGAIATQASGDATVTWTGDATEVTFTVGDNANYGSEGSGKAGQLCFNTFTITTAGSYSNYSTTCAAAPKAEVNPTTVSATAAGANGKVTVTYDNVKTENVAVALFNDAACTEAFTADWLTVSLDGDKNVTYTISANTLYTERKAYIKLTAPETTGATEPAVVVIPVTQAAKDKVFASLDELVAADLTAGDEVTVTLNNDVIKEFYIYSSKRCGVVFDVQKDGKDIKIYFNNQTTIDDWAVGGKLSGTLTNVKWTTYSSAWQLAPANTWAWANLTYTEPKAVSTVVVSGAPTKTTYVDGEAFDPAGLTVTVNYNDATSEVNPTGVTFNVTPATLTKGQTSVNVTATYNSISSAAYEVTGLTVNDIPTKTVAEFIASEGGRCYLEGIVSNITNTTYGNFDLKDASGKIYIYGCLDASGVAQKFATLGVKEGDKIKVIADVYELYQGTKQEAKNVQYVSHISAATITIADITMEVDETKTIAATIVPAEAEVTYTIKENAANAISLSGNTITARAEGTATITATVAEGADYLGNSVDFTVTVTPQNIATLPFAFDGGRDDIEATLGMSQDGLDSDYGSSPKLKFDGKDDYVIIHFDERPGKLTYDIKANTGSGDFSGTFTVQESADGVTYRNLAVYTTINTTKKSQTHNCFDKDTRYIKFIFTTKGNGNVALGNIKIEKSVVTKVTPTVVANSYFSVADGEFVQFSTGNLQYEVGTNTWSFAENQYDVIDGEAYTGSNNTNYGMNVPGYTGKLDLFGWSSDGKFGVNPSNTDAHYGYAGSDFVDWGELVNETGWYTLTKKEMNYILNRKKDGKKLWALATVNGLNGLILLPDNWNTNISLVYGYVPTQFVYTENQLNIVQWEELETAGAVFLPAGGSRTGGYGNTDKAGGKGTIDANGHYFHVDNVGVYGYYWLNTQDTRAEHQNCASFLILPGWDEGPTVDAEGIDDLSTPPTIWSREKRRGNSVRLVKKVTPNYTRDVRQGYYGTICLPTAGQMVGASIFEIAYKDASKIYFDEIVSGKMEAGIPYILLPNEGVTTLKVFYTEMAVVAAGSRNGLVGYYNNTDDMFNVPIGNYILLNNQYCEVVGTNAYIMQNYSYIVLGDVSGSALAPAPGVRRVSMGVTGQNTATGVDQVQGDAVPTKMIINGQLYILRGEKMYDAQGKLVK